MDLSHPLSSIAPSLEAEALTVLARTATPLTGRRVAELARRGSHVRLSNALDRLAQQGLVEVEPAGRAKLYRLNREHLLVPAITAALDATIELRARLGEHISGWRVQAVHASLYGSMARGEAGPESDIDVLVVRSSRLSLKDAETWSGQLTHLESDVWRWSGNTLSWFETTIADLKRSAAANEPIFASWREDSIHLAGEPLTPMLRRLNVQAGSR
ncbi:nucleotidyltransferase domain-containing protein [Knoellia sp. S7-12]|uniref:nucleotidyltransferase domain-containing protein n=1 Tax=Knoellia sp. S7-12 TaxID=3126698 RepID=UPI003366D9D7